MHSDCVSYSDRQENKYTNTNNSKGSRELSFTTPIRLERCCCCSELYETLQSGEADMNNSQQTAMTPEL